jgi:hypothetical protein
MNSNVNVLEIRNYLLKPNVLEHFIDYFEQHFIASQEAVNLQVLGQFRVIDEPNHFVWMRGFSDMQTRLEGLENFYYGPVWRQYGPLANELMLEWDDVHLLRPIDDTPMLLNGVNAASVAADLNAGTISPDTGVIAIDFYRALPGKRQVLIQAFQTQVSHKYERKGVQLCGSFIAEMAENKFTRLPVIQNEDEFVVITAYDNPDTYQSTIQSIKPILENTISVLLSEALQSLQLSPTLRSAMRYIEAK